MHYQPLWTIASGRVYGVEALLRWEHPERGLVGPSEFIGLAEVTGLIVPIGGLGPAHGLRAGASNGTARATTGLARCGQPLRPAVPPARPGRAGEERAAGQRRCRRQLLELEITETSAMQNAEATIATLRELKALGVRRGHRRLRRRLLVAGLPEAPAHRQPQDRPVLRARHHDRPGRRRHRDRRDRAGAHAEADRSWPRASRPPSSWRSCATAAATACRATC